MNIKWTLNALTCPTEWPHERSRLADTSHSAGSNVLVLVLVEYLTYTHLGPLRRGLLLYTVLAAKF